LEFIFVSLIGMALLVKTNKRLFRFFKLRRFGRRKRKFTYHRRKHSFDARQATQVEAQQVLHGRAHVIDGDTIVIGGTQIRLFGVDAPELDHPFGKKAKWALIGLCKGQKVRAEVTHRDKHGRTVARCSLADGSDLSAKMVSLGLAIDWPKYSNGQYAQLEPPGVRKKLWLANARQLGHLHVWEQYETKRKTFASEADD
jgi:endonuclease YncB( thermonuclease family)